MFAIETHRLTKTYDNKGGCRDISLTVPAGSIFGLLGPNGAGKSTLVKMLVGLLHPETGEAKVLNKSITDEALRQRVGFLPENFRYHDWLTGEDLLVFHGRLFGMSKDALAKRIPQVLDMVGLSGQGHKTVGSYSKGMQQRIGLACALLPDPDLVFLDEPTSALDPIGRKMVRDLTVNLREQGKTVFLNSHLLSELETVCNHIAIIRQGTLLYQGDWRQLTNQNYRVKVVMGWDDAQALPPTFPPNLRVVSQTTLQGAGGRQEYILQCNGEPEVPYMLKTLLEAGFLLYEVTPITDSLEKLFLQVVTEPSPWEGRE